MRNNDPFSDLLRSLEENMQDEEGEGGGGNASIPPDDRPNRNPQGGNPRRIIWIVLPLLVIIFFNRIVGFYTDYLWYDSLDLTSVFTTRLFASLGLFAVGALSFWLFLAINVWIARRLEPAGLARTPVEEFAQAIGIRMTSLVLVAGALFALIMGLAASGSWETVLLYLNQQQFGLTDPLFQRDVSFYLFTLPIWTGIRAWLMVTTVVTLIATVVISGLGWQGWHARTPVLAHLAVLGAIILGLIAWQYRLDALQLVYSSRGAVFGAGHADVNAQLPAYNLLSIVTAIAAVLLVVVVFMRQAWRAMVGVLAIWILASVLAGNVYPGLVQRFQVTPNELTLEQPYIEDNIAYTRTAFDLADIDLRSYSATDTLVSDDILAEISTVSNVRLWDYRPLLQTYNQIQVLRQYYLFNDIDIDRYQIDGETRQVMLAARELVPDQLSQEAQTWVNRQLVYTHGYGAAASPVAQVTSDGLPDFYLQDLPPTGSITVTQPQIYFGELTEGYVIGGSDEPEFDYPSGGGIMTTTFSADTGIDMNLWSRLVFAIRFADINMILNSDIGNESQLLWRRNIMERVNEVAPFLQFDQDPYIVIDDDGRMHWMLDAYTTSNRFPYSRPLGSVNYIRNAVKVVISAYDGTMQFYVVDQDDPLIAAYQQIFPALFQPMEQMPADLQRHVRYPTDLFSVQAEVYRTYHMTDPVEFYNREDLWAWPTEIFQNQTQTIEPYYVLMELPDEDVLEYAQILPFTPANRQNMVAWMVARSDPEFYGEIRVYEFGPETLFFGPAQIEARIDQDPEISAQLALWNQQGSSVIRGNLLVIPVGNSLLYVEPLYLQSETGQIPELQRVIVATADQVVMAQNLGLALAGLFGEELLSEEALANLATFGGDDPDALSLEDQEISGGGALEGRTIEQLVTRANDQFRQAQEMAQSGDWAAYGEQIAELEATLQQLAEQSGISLESGDAITPTTEGELEGSDLQEEGQIPEAEEPAAGGE